MRLVIKCATCLQGYWEGEKCSHCFPGPIQLRIRQQRLKLYTLKCKCGEEVRRYRPQGNVVCVLCRKRKMKVATKKAEEGLKVQYVEYYKKVYEYKHGQKEKRTSET